MPAIDASSELLDLTRKSGLVDDKVLAAYLASREKNARPLPEGARDLATDFVRDGLLTQFQASQLLAGKTRGFVISNKYKLLEHLGAGGMGSVYLCEHTSMKRRVAIKVLPIARANDTSYLERFYREARAVGALDHPNIVRAFDIDRDDRLHFLVMEYVDGTNLHDMVRKTGPLDIYRASHYISQAAQGLQHAHDAGLVHRDIKPANLLVDRSGTVKILDLGLARFFHDDDNLSRRHDETVLGTTDYLAPEQTVGSDVDGRADIYSLGVTFYFLLTGSALFGEGTSAQKLIWHQIRQPRPIRSLRQEVPEELAEIIEHRMLAKDPKDRFQKPIEICKALEPWTEIPITPPLETEMPRLCPAARGSAAETPPMRTMVGRAAPSTPGHRRKIRSEQATIPKPKTSPSIPIPASPTPRSPRPRPVQTSSVVQPGTSSAGAPESMKEEEATVRPASAKRLRRSWLPAAIAAVVLLGVGALGVAGWLLSRYLAAEPGPQAVASGNGIESNGMHHAFYGPGASAQSPETHPAHLSSPPAAGVQITNDRTSFRIQTSRYEAAIEGDGCMPQLRAGGADILRSGVDISRGLYLFQDGPLLLPTVQRSGDAITARGDRGSIQYDFAPSALTCTASNATDKPMRLFMVFSPEVHAFRNGSGEWFSNSQELPEDIQPDKKWDVTTWFTGKARLTISGGSKVWGPWSDQRLQVWEALLTPHETRKVVVTVDTPSPQELARVAALTGSEPPVDLDLVVSSPVDFQVFQRYSRQRGQIQLRGRVRPACTDMEVRLTGTSLDGSLPGKWEAVGFNADEKTFDSTVPVAAGGWYRMEIRALQRGKTVAEWTVEHVGVGEVFVIAGQSNSTNCGEERLKPASGMVATFSGKSWRPADDPQPGVHDQTMRGSPWPAFGDALYEKCRVPIGIASTGHSGSSVNQWQPGSEFFRWMMQRIRQLGSGGFRAVLWHQGETDVGMSQEEYQRLLTTVIQASHKEAGWDFPWFVACVSYHNPGNPTYSTTRSAQQKLWQQKIALEGPDTDKLTGDHRDEGGKGIHFSGKGLRAHGKLWAEKVAPYLDRVLAE